MPKETIKLPATRLQKNMHEIKLMLDQGYEFIVLNIKSKQPMFKFSKYEDSASFEEISKLRSFDEAYQAEFPHEEINRKKKSIVERLQSLDSIKEDEEDSEPNYEELYSEVDYLH